MPKKILIVDDEKTLTDTLAAYLRGAKGYAVFTAEDGEKAEEIIKKENLDLVLLDMKLPKVDGLEVLKLLRRQYPKTKVIVMTCYDVEYKKKTDAIGYDHFFMKPLLIRGLQDKVEELLALDLARETQKVKQVSFAPAEKGGINLEKEAFPAPPQRESITLEAKLLLIEPRRNIANFLRDFFKEESLSGGRYVVTANLYTHDLEGIAQFLPDIVLYDVILIGLFSDFASELMQLKNPPKEIILFGDPSNKWEEVDVLIGRGMKYIQTPFATPEQLSKLLSFDLKYPSKDTVERLCAAVEKACLKYGLYKKKG